MTSKLTRERLAKIKSWRETYGAGSNVMLPAEDAEELARIALAAMDSEPDRNPVLAYADSYRDMAKQGVESVPIWSVITDLERNIAPLYRHAQPAPVVPGGYVMVAASLLSELRDWAHPKIEDYCEMWAGRRDDEFPALRKVIADTDALLEAAPQSPGSEPATVPGKWIPVSERMPEAEGHYLVWANASRIDGYCDHLAIATYQGREWSNEFNWLVTHWMPLPAAPREVK
ncbi:TPA: DUF551 domain-containing protein [Klebsiella pneumoniae]|nr:DUF551 domain-containing protein [Klebsiella pneumoniae]EKX4113668.1 DUF551 domain-containing protein [Klebsiella pneumoniae]MCE7333469.1 DUF551 domain-containing protein [Klebsiella pneumoniae]SVX66988.1 Eaa1 [Klebsiella pneumoniae]HBQ8745427.1 DUF551 domain-containing protein [Klebsiella pneumoniae]HBT0510890.1 DUF551 domain-containing protein [Klebsiella pneumoniae]